jgi:translation initiation factor 2B subunit (eIF-2B alpha/beta/delta family)
MTTGKLNKILSNKTRGSSELVILLNKYFLSIRNNPAQVKESIKLAQKKLGHFEGVNSYLIELNNCIKKRNGVKLTDFLKEYSKVEDEKVQIIFNKIYPALKKMRGAITLSRSGTVLILLQLWHKKNKNLRVIVCESRPKYEGRLLAKDLIKGGIKVQIITDAMMGAYVPKIDAAIIGADLILKNKNIVNKVGSKGLALFCRQSKKPFYVVSTRNKFSNRNSFKPKKENSKEVWNKKAKNLEVSNIYFEEVENKFITKIFTD